MKTVKIRRPRDPKSEGYSKNFAVVVGAADKAKQFSYKKDAEKWARQNSVIATPIEIQTRFHVFVALKVGETEIIANES